MPVGRRPLYKSLADAQLTLAPDGHTGLWFDKFFDRWGSDWKIATEGKLGWIEGVIRSRDAVQANGSKRGSRPCGSVGLLSEATTRLIAFTLARQGRFVVFTSESRFVTGLGRSHPVENGFSWHPTLGVPYIPGTSVKGLINAWARETGNARVDDLFGSSRGAGKIAFLDAIPVAPVELEADVLTPHYGGWDLEHLPADWRSPTPVPFLVVGAGTSFAFSMIPCASVPESAVEEARSLLEAALREAGAGAKTGVGYGRFAFDAGKTRVLQDRLTAEREERLARSRRAELECTPAGRWGLMLQGQSEDRVAELVRLHLGKERLPDAAERLGLAQAVEATGLLAYWRLGKKREVATHPGGSKLKERATLVDAELSAGPSESAPRSS